MITKYEIKKDCILTDIQNRMNICKKINKDIKTKNRVLERQKKFLKRNREQLKLLEKEFEEKGGSPDGTRN